MYNLYNQVVGSPEDASYSDLEKAMHALKDELSKRRNGFESRSKDLLNKVGVVDATTQQVVAKLLAYGHIVEAVVEA